MIQNRIEKNWKKLDPWARQHQIEAFRIYDHDIPEFPFFIDKYKDYFVVYDRSDSRDEGKNQLPLVIESLIQIFRVEKDHIVIKKRDRQKGDNQYEKLNSTEKFFWIQESQAKLRVNLWDYLDTGLFLDHRPMRQKIFKDSKNKRFLNLFCYTGSVSVFAALGGAQTTSVDMSATYLDWLKENFRGNSLPFEEHLFLQENVLEYLENQATGKYDIIFLDPPTFSNSKRMNGTFDVDRDHESLVKSCILRLEENGTLYFSTNSQRFKISDHVLEQYVVKDITKISIPRDFHNQKIHKCYQITSRP